MNSETRGGGARILRLALPAYFLLLLGVAALGATNQRLYARQLALMAEKETLTGATGAARRSAMSVAGPAAVANWAAERGMVPAPEILNEQAVVSEPAPLPEPPTPSLEVRTIWR